MVLSLRSLNLPPKCLEAAHRAHSPILYFVFFLSWIWYRGVPLGDSFRLSLVVGIQIASGSLIWRRICWRLDPSALENFGMGLAVGTAVSTIFDQLFLNTFLQPIAWLLPLIFVVLFSLVKPLQVREAPSGSLDVRVMFVLSTAVILGFGTLRHGYGLLIGGFVIGFLISREKTILFQVFTYVTSLIVGFLVLVALRPAVEYGSWRMRPLYTGTDDLVFSESLSQSLSHFGIFEHSAAVGVHLRYHWFSLAWSGLTSRVASAEPFDVTLHVVPFVAFLGIAMLVWTIAFRLTKSKIASNISILVLFCANSLPENIRFFYVLNTSNILSYIWVLAAILIFLYAIETQYKRWILIFPTMLAISLLAKLPYGAVLLAATSGALIYAIFRVSQLRVFASVMLLASILISYTTYLIFLTPSSWEQRSYALNLNPFHFSRASVYSVSATIFLVVSLMVVRFPFSPSLLRESGSTTKRVFLVFLSLGSLAGLARFVIDGGSAEKYFLNSSLILGSILASFSFFVLTKSTVPKQHNHMVMIYTSLVFFILLPFNIIKDSKFFENLPLNPNSESIVAAIIPLLLALMVHLNQSIISKEKKSSFWVFLFVGFIGVSSGSFFLQALVNEPYNFTASVASTTDIESLNWVRSNTEKMEILATNRYLCNQDSPCSFDDSSFLISAISRRRVLIEGPRFVAGYRPYPDWAKDRVQKSIDFANSPSEKSWSQLKLFGVGWFYLDTNFVTPGFDTSNNPWSPWATVAYHNSNVYILKLKE